MSEALKDGSSRILITGATGTIGRRVVDAARAAGHRVIAVARGATAAFEPASDLEPIDLDLTDGSADLASVLAGVESVIHLAGGASADIESSSFVVGTRRLVEAIAAMDVSPDGRPQSRPRLVLAGSISVYDYAAVAEHGEIDETSAVIAVDARRDAYARCKRRQEELVLAAATGDDDDDDGDGDGGGGGGDFEASILRIGSVVTMDDASPAAVSPRLGLRFAGRWFGPSGSPMPLVDIETVAGALVGEAVTRRVKDGGSSITNLVGLAQPTGGRHARDLAAASGRPVPRTGLPWWLMRLCVTVIDGILGLPGLDRLPRPSASRRPSLDARFKPVRFSNELALRRGLLAARQGGDDPGHSPVVAYLTGEYPRATDTFVQREVAGLRAIGFEVQTFSVRKTPPSHHVGPEQRQEAANTTTLLPLKPGWLLRAHLHWILARPLTYLRTLRQAVAMRRAGLEGFMFQLFYFAEAGMLAHAMSARGCRHLHNHFANSSCSVAVLASSLSGIPFSFTTHGPAIFFEPRVWRLDLKVAAARFVSCISHFCRSQVMAFSRVQDWPRLHIIHCGVDPAMYDSEPRGDGRTRLLFVGRLAPVKGVPVLLEAVAGLGPEVSLTIIGDGELRADIERTIRERGLEDRVQVLGFLSQAEIAANLREHDIFVMASFAEGVPVVLMEAMAAGLPVIATRIAGISELVEDDRCGLLVPPSDVGPLRAAIAELAADPERRAAMGTCGRAVVVEQYDAAMEAARLGRLFLMRSEPVRCEPLVIPPGR